jgi:hypothetical protein
MIASVGWLMRSEEAFPILEILGRASPDFPSRFSISVTDLDR